LADLFAVNNAAACQPDYETVTERASVHRMEAATTSQTAKPVLQTEKHFIIGATAHNVQEALAAEAAGADYLGCGAVFATNTKKDTVPLGLEGLRAIRKAVHIPIVGIAGITPKNYQQVLAVGADGAAVVSGILGADDISETVTAFLAGR
jgi:thiamine-phosphate diphosphorylase